MIRGAFDRFRDGLRKTRDSFVGQMSGLLGGGARLDAETLDRIEELLIGADMGVKSSLQIVQSLEQRVKEGGGEASLEGVLAIIRGDVVRILTTATPKVRPPAWGEVDGAGGGKGGKGRKGRKGGKGRKGAGGAGPPEGEAGEAAGAVAAGPETVFVVGVNGTGKTTSIAKLAAMYRDQGRSVLLAAADTFRAAAVEQLRAWAERVGVECVSRPAGSDPAAVVYDALDRARAGGHDVVIVDTAGRLHTKVNLMAELGKVERVIERRLGRPPRTLLVVDANTGQNGLAQARMFAETIPVDGLILTKLDGTAKGGIVVAIAETIGLPVRYVGTGEKAEDWAEFDPEAFADALFAGWSAAGA